MFHLIIVPLDGTRFAEHAVPAAIALASASDGRLLLAHVDVAPLPLAEPRAVSLDTLSPTGPDAAVVDYLRDVADRVARSVGLQAELIVLTGETPSAVARLAVDTDADLITMASHDRSALRRLVTPSVSERIVRESGLPVLLVRRSDAQLAMERDADPASVFDPISSPPVEFRHILVPLDGAPPSEAVLDPAIRLAQATGARISLLTVVEGAQREGASSDGASRGYLEEVAHALRAQGVAVDVVELHGDDVATAILDAVTDLSADAIAMATHRRGGLTRLALGSVATKVLHGVLMPVLIVRPGAVKHASSRHHHGASADDRR